MEENLLEADIPEKFKDPKTGELRVNAMLKSYKDLEHRLSSAPSAPKTPEDYCINCDHGMFESDPEVNRRLHEKGFSHDQAQEVYNLAAEKMVPMMVGVAGEFKADAEVEKLINHFGGAEKWQEVSRQLLAFGQKNMPEDVLDSLSSSFEGVIALERMMKSDEPSLQRSGGTNVQGVNHNELSSMMRDPRYWRDKDPSFVAKVTEGFQNMYGK